MTTQIEAVPSAGADAAVPVPAVGPLRPRVGRFAYIGVAGVGAVQAAVIGWHAAHNWFFVDDFIFLRQAKDAKFGLSFLRVSLFEHFSPVHRIADWLLIRGAGPSWPVAATVLVTLTVGCTIAFAYLVSSITDRGRVIVAMTGLYALSLFFIRTSIWWTAGVHILSVTLFSMLALGGYVRWHRWRSVPALVLSIVALAFALLTHEDALLLVGVLVLLRVVVLTPHPRSVRDLWRAFLDDAWVWVSYVFLTSLAVWNFVTFYWQQQDRPGLGELVHYLWFSVAEGFFATLFLMKIPEAMVHSPRVTGVIALSAGAVVVGVTLLVRAGSWRPWLFFGLGFLATALPLGLSRIGQFGVTIGRDPVYQLGPAYLFLFALAIAITGPRRGALDARWSAWASARPGLRLALAGLVVVAFVGVYLHATNRVVDRGAWQAGPTREYFSNLRGDVSALNRRGIHPEIVNQTVPSNIVLPWESPFDRTAMNLMVPSIGSSGSNKKYVATVDGHLHPVEADEQFGERIPVAVAAKWGWGPKHGGTCMEPLPGARPITLVLPEALEGPDFVVKVVSREAQAVDGIVYADNIAAPVTLDPGATSAYFHSPTIAQVGLQVPESACIERISVEKLIPRSS